jgi:glycogen debranching enzyme
VETRHRLTNEALPVKGNRRGVPKNTLALERERLIRGGVIRELITVRNHGRRAARFQVELAFRAHFEDLFIVKGFVKGPRGRLDEPHVVDEARVELAYEGLDERRRSTTLAFHPRPDALDAERAAFELALEPGEEREISVAIQPAITAREEAADGGPLPDVAPAQLRRWLDRSESLWVQQAASVHASNPLFDRVFQRALLDLRLLRSTLGGLHYFAAGLPWFGTLFGRDAARRLPDAPVRTQHGGADAAPARPPPGHRARRVPGRRPRQDPPRAAER